MADERERIVITPTIRNYLRAFDAWLKHEWAHDIRDGELRERKDMALTNLLTPR